MRQSRNIQVLDHEFEARLEKKLTARSAAIAAMLSAIRQLMNPPPPKRCYPYRPCSATMEQAV